MLLTIAYSTLQSARAVHRGCTEHPQCGSFGDLVGASVGPRAGRVATAAVAVSGLASMQTLFTRASGCLVVALNSALGLNICHFEANLILMLCLGAVSALIPRVGAKLAYIGGFSVVTGALTLVLTPLTLPTGPETQTVEWGPAPVHGFFSVWHGAARPAIFLFQMQSFLVPAIAHMENSVAFPVGLSCSFALTAVPYVLGIAIQAWRGGPPNIPQGTPIGFPIIMSQPPSARAALACLFWVHSISLFAVLLSFGRILGVSWWISIRGPSEQWARARVVVVGVALVVASYLLSTAEPISVYLGPTALIADALILGLFPALLASQHMARADGEGSMARAVYVAGVGAMAVLGTIGVLMGGVGLVGGYIDEFRDQDAKAGPFACVFRS